MFGFFLSYFFITVANTVKCNTCNNIRNSIYKERRKKMRKNQVFLHHVFIEDLLFLYNDIIV